MSYSVRWSKSQRIANGTACRVQINIQTQISASRLWRFVLTQKVIGQRMRAKINTKNSVFVCGESPKQAPHLNAKKIIPPKHEFCHLTRVSTIYVNLCECLS